MIEKTIAMDAPFEQSLLDRVSDPVVGRATSRIEGPLKVSGTARYAAEHAFEGLLYGCFVQAPIGAGRISRLDVAAALKMPGVVAVIDDTRLIRNPGLYAGADAPVQSVLEIGYFRQPIALVVADTFERARAAVMSVGLELERTEGVFDFERNLASAAPPSKELFPARSEQGDIGKALAEAAAVLDEVWTTPSQSQAAMEPHASIAVWEDGQLTVYGSYQQSAVARDQLAAALGIDVASVRVVSRFVGGGFGSKLAICPEAVAAAIAARETGRPVKVVMARQQVFDMTTRRSETQQRVRLGADRDGRLTAIAHETIASNLEGELFFEPAGVATHFLYAGANRKVDHRLVPVNKVMSGSMRAPGEAVGLLALEGAMDELAEKLGIDPLELRLRNDPERDPENEVPFSSRSLRKCLQVGAERFGWEARNRVPGGLKDGEWLIGHGLAAAARSNMLLPSRARVAIRPDGRVTLITEMTDIGTGTYTILAQIAADLLGVPLSKVDVQLGDSNHPRSAGSGGSWGACSSGSSVYAACQSLREQLAAAAGCAVEEAAFTDEHLVAGQRRWPLQALVGPGLSAEGAIQPGAMEQRFTQASFGAHFCEVRVNATTGETRISRWNSVFAAGRILNAKTAASQCIGGIVFGIGSALMEDLVHDSRTGKIVNRDLGEYHVPAHADIPELDVLLLDERDPHANPLHAKGIGELGIGGAGAAVANAIYNATGVRVREFPITLDKLLPRLPVT